MYDVVTVGNALLDIFMHVEENNMYASLNKEEHMLSFTYGQKIHVDHHAFMLGGNACNVAVGVGRLGLKSGLCAEIGDDEFSKKIIRNLTQEPIDNSLLIQTKGSRSSFSVGIGFQGERTLFVQHVPRAHDFHFDTVDTKWVYLTSLGIEWKEAYNRVLSFVKTKGVKLAFSPGTHQFESFDALRTREEGLETIHEVLSSADILFVNKEEARRIVSGISNFQFPISNEKENVQEIKKLLSELQRLGARVVVITDGEDGSYAIDERGICYHIKVFSSKVVEKTGAGDGYASGFISAVLLSKDVKEAMRWGGVNAAAVIEHVGAQAGLLSREKLSERLAANEDFQAKEL